MDARPRLLPRPAAGRGSMNFAAVGERHFGRATPSLKRRSPTATHNNTWQRIHLSEAKRCSDEAGHLKGLSQDRISYRGMIRWEPTRMPWRPRGEPLLASKADSSSAIRRRLATAACLALHRRADGGTGGVQRQQRVMQRAFGIALGCVDLFRGARGAPAAGSTHRRRVFECSNKVVVRGTSALADRAGSYSIRRFRSRTSLPYSS
jgi:hypothetical protein